MQIFAGVLQIFMKISVRSTYRLPESTYRSVFFSLKYYNKKVVLLQENRAMSQLFVSVLSSLTCKFKTLRVPYTPRSEIQASELYRHVMNITYWPSSNTKLSLSAYEATIVDYRRPPIILFYF